MNRIFKKTSLTKINRVYAYKLEEADVAVREQKKIVQQFADELAERQAIVQSLQDKLVENQRYMSSPDVNTNPQVIQSALRYRHWILYDKERQSYYVDVTQQELDESLMELQSRQKTVSKLNTKIDTITQFSQNADTMTQILQDLESEEEIGDLLGSRCKINV